MKSDRNVSNNTSLHKKTVCEQIQTVSKSSQVGKMVHVTFIVILRYSFLLIILRV